MEEDLERIQMLISTQDAIRNAKAFFVCLVDENSDFKAYYSGSELNTLETKGFEALIQQTAQSLDVVALEDFLNGDDEDEP